LWRRGHTPARDRRARVGEFAQCRAVDPRVGCPREAYAAAARSEAQQKCRPVWAGIP